MSLWDSLFAHLQQPVAQVLLTRNDIADVSDFRTLKGAEIYIHDWKSGHNT